MKVITPKILTETASERWDEQYLNWREATTAQLIKGDQLRELISPTKKQIEEIIGNNTWTTFICNECGQFSDRGIEFEKPYSIDNHTYCDGCIRKAFDQL